MRLGFAHQSTGGLAIAQAVRELLSGKVPRIRFAIARQPHPRGSNNGRLLEFVEFGLAQGQPTFADQVRFCVGKDPLGPGSHMLIGAAAGQLDAVDVAAVMTEELMRLRAQHPGADVFRPLEDCPEFPSFGVFTAEQVSG